MNFKKSLIQKLENFKSALMISPKIIIKDNAVYHYIYKWLEDKPKTIDENSYEYLKNEFSKILKLTGINKSETCILSIKNYNKTNRFALGIYILDCHLQKEDKNIEITLIESDGHDFTAEIIIKDKNEMKKYEYINTYKIKDAGTGFIRIKEKLIIPISYTKENKNNKLTRYYSPYRVKFIIENSEHKFSIVIENTKKYNINEDIFYLNNEEKLMNYLQEQSLPLYIDELFMNEDGINILSEKNLEEYFNNEHFPIEFSQAFKSICNILGITKENIINEYREIKIKLTKLPEEKIINSLTIINGTYHIVGRKNYHITRNDNLEINRLKLKG